MADVDDYGGMETGSTGIASPVTCSSSSWAAIAGAMVALLSEVRL